jgi:O-antigen/teichoic acid export membrane protein
MFRRGNITLTFRIAGFFDQKLLLQRLYVNTGILLGGNVSSGALGLASLVVLTWAVSLEAIGLFAVVTAYITVIEHLAGFQSWQALIHYGTHALHQRALPRLTSLLVFGWMLDFGGSVFGCAVALLIAAIAPVAFGLDQAGTAVILTATATLLFSWTSVPTAVLRLCNKFYVQALAQNIASAVRLVGYVTLYISGTTSLFPYIAMWSFGMLLGRLILVFAAVLEARSHGLLRRRDLDLEEMFVSCPGIWKFVLSTKADAIIRVLRELDVFVVNAVLGSMATGLYKTARELARTLTYATDPLQQAIYPELARLAASKDFSGLSRLVLQSSMSLGLVVGVGWIAFMFVGESLIVAVFGTSYRPSYEAAFWCVGAVVLWASALPLLPALLALGKVRTSLILHAATSAAYLVVLLALTRSQGLTGAGLAYFLFYGLWSAAKLAALGATLRNVTGRPATGKRS